MSGMTLWSHYVYVCVTCFASPHIDIAFFMRIGDNHIWERTKKTYVKEYHIWNSCDESDKSNAQHDNASLRKRFFVIWRHLIAKLSHTLFLHTRIQLVYLECPNFCLYVCCDYYTSVMECISCVSTSTTCSKLSFWNRTNLSDRFIYKGNVTQKQRNDELGKKRRQRMSDLSERKEKESITNHIPSFSQPQFYCEPWSQWGKRHNRIRVACCGTLSVSYMLLRKSSVPELVCIYIGRTHAWRGHEPSNDRSLMSD